MGEGNSDYGSYQINLEALYRHDGSHILHFFAYRTGPVRLVMHKSLQKPQVFVSPELSSVRDYVITHSVRCMYVVCMYM